MADEADIAQTQIDQHLAHCIANRKKVITSIGACWYCNTALGPGFLFCNHECRDDFQEEERLKAIAGKK